MQRSGSAFLLSLVVTLVLAGIAMSMGQGISQQLHAHDFRAAQAQARYAGLGVLRACLNDLNTATADYGIPSLIQVYPDGELVGEHSVFFLGRDPQSTQMQYGLIPEAARIDLNNAGLDVLAALPGMDESIAAAIIDWRDDNDEIHEAGGAERGDAYYTSARIPYAPRNAPFETLEELRLVRGVTDALWFGEDRNENGVLDPGEDADRDGQLDLGLRDCLCLEAREPALNADGSERVPLMPFNQNVRTVFVDALGEERGAELYAQALPQAPFTSRLHALSVLEELSADEAALIWPKLIGPEGRVGLVDVYHAQLPVLSAVFGVELAQRVHTQRPITDGGSLHWLLAIMDSEEIAQFGPLLTHGSYQFKADIVSVAQQARAWDRIHVSIDASNAVARVLRIQPAQFVGWPWSQETLSSLRRSEQQDIIGRLNGGATTW